eukprot:TRINITY_DN1122_c0_g1_i14.p9 TRINITY_DN1122_c0_g1~~TRINITY_DN1122_c0_g1_i14.p9  ORF type:complete len:101 (-),score=2.32 TRINITY_DN1122_c0_g1_i14:610-912(-)
MSMHIKMRSKRVSKALKILLCSTNASKYGQVSCQVSEKYNLGQTNTIVFFRKICCKKINIDNKFKIHPKSNCFFSNVLVQSSKKHFAFQIFQCNARIRNM